ncbi:cytochrome P450 [Pseudomonas aeruginosa]|uniref:cytochrome P450 n=1 Tax=Pseudomonas aeruginosa TaxID=287 RepID=UPI0004D40B4C|nr:cytochrome P450 [Pseudomonas aeruginosa]KEA17108.1 cytochrome P450 [Pseudomonas aeruginosa C1913C]KSE46824.1 cytochrome P450 [Pseudomonas aeruginosa]QYE94879.1 cytochrome P450 [Pseudomonas aeruginosa]TEM03403.1 cytochrome P450 [Pseudomonas aeruginosa]TEO54404.1 cytochrome P450 [Pseudomonas aeruginosa]
MSTSTASDLDLKNNYTAVSETYRGTDLDIHEVCREQLLKSPIYEGDFITQFGVPTNAGIQQGTRPTFALFKYQDVMAVLRDGNTYTSGFIAEGLGAFFDGLVILAMDGEAHRKVRALLQPAFMPESVNKWRGQIDEAIREEYLKPLVPQKKADLMEFGLELPIRIMYALMGFPTDDPSKYKQYAAWALAMVGGNQIDPAKMAEARKQAGIAVKGLYDAIQGVVVQRRAEGSHGDDVVGRLLRAEYEGRTLDDHEVITFTRSLLPAAGETTTRMFGSVMAMLLTTPGLLERVKADRSLIPKLMDETTRYEPVATFKVRETAKDVEFHGVKIPKGSFVQCMVVSANRDPDAFENPDVFDIDRKLKPSFGFGFGPHMCIGQFIAKVEISCSINAILDLFPNIRLDPSQPAPVIEGAQLRGVSSLPVIWD